MSVPNSAGYTHRVQSLAYLYSPEALRGGGDSSLWPQIGQPSSTFSATLSTVRMEAKTSVQRVPVFVPDAEGAAATVGVA
jgi:hypothetical protein